MILLYLNMRKLIPATFLLIIFALFLQIQAEQTVPVQWSKSISKAVSSRDSFYKYVGISSRETFNLVWTSEGSNTLSKKLERYNEPRNVWFYFLRGISTTRSSVQQSAENFNKAIQLCRGRPGTAWVLFNEFRFIKQKRWADKCLVELERSMLASGTLSLPLAAQQLMVFADKEDKAGNQELAQLYQKWARRFERAPFWQDALKGFNSIPSDPGNGVESFKSVIQNISNSWILQVSLLRYLYKWLKIAIIFFIISILLVTISETLPVAIHPTMENFPVSVIYNLKYFLTIAILLSFSVFSIIAVLLLLILLLWPYSNKKGFLSICAVFLVLSPVDARIEEALRKSISETGPAGLFRNAIYHSWERELEVTLSANLETEGSNHLSHLSAAIYTFKKGSLQSSLYHLRNAEKIKPNDPVLLTTTGNLFALNNDPETAETYFKKCLKLYPNDPYATYNLGQLKIRNAEAAEGGDLIAKAARLSPIRVNNFITDNAHYFNNDWPRLREYIQADYSPDYFWKNIFPSSRGDWNSTSDMWGISLFGIPAKISAVLLPLAFMIAFAIRKKTANDIVNYCKLCGNPMCRKCRDGAICNTCSHATESSHNENIKNRIRQKIIAERRRKHKLKALILNLIFPGSGTIYNRDNIRISGVALIFFTSIFYATYYTIATVKFSYQSALMDKMFFLLIAVPVIYNIFFFGTFIKDILGYIEEGKNHGS